MDTIYYMARASSHEDLELKIPKWLKTPMDQEWEEAFERGKKDMVNKINGLLDR
jgi:hypothetical protein